MPDFNKNIQDADGWHQSFGRAYLFTNENVAEYISQFNMDGKRILSVTASGDHAFECLLAGASFVDTFDINYAQKTITELKKHMIQNLSYEDFMDFFFEEKNFFDKKIIEPIWKYFSQELSLYMDWYYCLGSCAPRHMFVYGKPNINSYDKNKISYIADKEMYEKLSHKLPKKISFTHTEVNNLVNCFDVQYDFILLSNIFDYIYSPLCDDYDALTQCYEGLLKPLINKNLSPNNGHILFQYMWSGKALKRTELMDAWQKFAHKFNRKKRDYGLHASHKCVPSPILQEQADIILYLTQNIKVK